MQQIFCEDFTLLLEELSNFQERKGSQVITLAPLRLSYVFRSHIWVLEEQQNIAHPQVVPCCRFLPCRSWLLV
jgi:hypothetical protein